jgi:hypothetical protein
MLMLLPGCEQRTSYQGHPTAGMLIMTPGRVNFGISDTNCNQQSTGFKAPFILRCTAKSKLLMRISPWQMQIQWAAKGASSADHAMVAEHIRKPSQAPLNPGC